MAFGRTSGRPGVFSFALFVCMAGALWLSGSAQATFPGQNGRISFSTPAAEIGLVYPDGRDRVELTDGSHQRWSPDGMKLAFRGPECDECPFDAYTINADGTGLQLVGHDIPWLDWSPDGTKFVLSRTSPPALHVMNIDGSGDTTITAPPVGVGDGLAVWSPDGTKIAFRRGGDPLNGDIYTVNPDGTGLTNITNSFGQGNDFPNWSPDGSKLLFTRVEPLAPFIYRRAVWTMNPDGSGKTRIGEGNYPVWSPDGQRIAFIWCADVAAASCGGSENRAIHTTDLNRGNATLVRADGHFETLAWEPCASPCPPPPPPSYDVPKYANVLDVALVPNLRQTISTSQCEARGGTPSSHGPPLAFSSCNPPGYVPGTVARMGNLAVSIFDSRAVLGVTTGSPAPGDQADFSVYADVVDVHTAAGAEYLSGARLVARLRITDSYNGPSLADPATTLDFEISAPTTCTATPSSPARSRCLVSTSADALTPGTVKENKDMVIQAFRPRMYDSGVDGVLGNGDDRTFAVPGIYIP